ncbi:helix-turn-helix transcriptional regulator [Paraclostridium sordellii]|uniref:helix-turn-helix transcriptional regulator n=1 Tax=Paraclostridium sordellii TaxID=1505 RepID=UPI000E529581|nr:helix-turn-helix transcriptional regulator [Paeniclostridium sordellii]RGX09344.1 helix-turn-helix domain-containing protein [Paeniclostridium sordellii]
MKEIQFAKNLKNLRKMYGMSMTELSKLINVSKQSISKYEKGCYPSFHIVITVAETFNCSLDDLVYGDIENNPNRNSLDFKDFIDKTFDDLKKEFSNFNREFDGKINDTKREIFKSIEIAVEDTHCKDKDC